MPLRRIEQRRPRQLAEVGVRQRQHVDRSRNADRDAGVLGGQEAEGLAVGVQEHLRRRAHRRDLAAVVGGHDAGLGVVVQHEGAAAEAGALRLHQTQHGLHGHRGVDCGAARAQDLHAGRGGERMGGRDQAGAGRLLGVRSPAVAGPLARRERERDR
jgi:hypothetical protein